MDSVILHNINVILNRIKNRRSISKARNEFYSSRLKWHSILAKM